MNDQLLFGQVLNLPSLGSHRSFPYPRTVEQAVFRVTGVSGDVREALDLTRKNSFQLHVREHCLLNSSICAQDLIQTRQNTESLFGTTHMIWWFLNVSPDFPQCSFRAQFIYRCADSGRYKGNIVSYLTGVETLEQYIDVRSRIYEAECIRKLVTRSRRNATGSSETSSKDWATRRRYRVGPDAPGM